MKIPLPGPVVSAVLLVGVGAVVGVAVFRRSPSARTPLPCNGEYSDSLQIQAAHVREIEQGPRAKFTYLVRSSAAYECPYFGPDGALRRRRKEAREHGTAFAYETRGNETFLLTNEHVVVWPEVTDTVRKVDGVHEGCKKVEEKIRIVHDEHDEYEPSHVPLSRVAADPLLDAAILKAAQPLTTLPYRIGKSAALRQGNAVQVRGFPLGLLHAVNTGKVVNPYDRDQEQGWDHTDFVVDALLSEGNSGSPVMALSCRTGELELVGMYHAGYKGHSALNVVVYIDQLREFMAKKRRVPRGTAESGQALAASGRTTVREALAGGAMPLFAIGGLHLFVEARGEALVYHLYGRDFPADDRRLAVLEDLPASSEFGQVARMWVRGDFGWRELTREALHPDDRDMVERTADALRTHMLAVVRFRRALTGPGSADQRRRAREGLRSIERLQPAARELAAGLTELVERLAPAGPAGVANAADGGTAPAAPVLRAANQPP